jgi:hypothetical protein
MNEKKNDGIYGMLDRNEMPDFVRKWRDTFDITPGLGFVQKEFGYFCLEQWAQQGMPQDIDKEILFGFEPQGEYRIRGIGWTEPNYFPKFEEKIIRSDDQYEVVSDIYGRHVLYFKGRRTGFMPTYVDHPVKDMKTWEEDVRWRLDPFNSDRQAAVTNNIGPAVEHAKKGYFITQRLVGGYMYLRAMIGPEDVLYKFYDEPELIHACMETWLHMADNVIARYQQHVTLDQLFIGEDICYNGGPLISPDMIREFLFPYYQQLLTNMRRRQLDPARHLYFQVDTDGDCMSVIDLYRTIGMDVMSPFEVASGSDVVEAGRKYPDLVISGGFDKRILAAGKEAIDREIDRIFPVMKARGGYIPTCDHGVPEEVRYEDYLHFRKRCLEYA